MVQSPPQPGVINDNICQNIDAHIEKRTNQFRTRTPSYLVKVLHLFHQSTKSAGALRKRLQSLSRTIPLRPPFYRKFTRKASNVLLTTRERQRWSTLTASWRRWYICICPPVRLSASFRLHRLPVCTIISQRESVSLRQCRCIVFKFPLLSFFHFLFHTLARNT